MMYLEQRVEELERRLAELEARIRAPAVEPVMKPAVVKTTKIKPCTVDAELAAAMQKCHTDADFVRLAQSRIKQIEPPAILGDVPIAEVMAAACSVHADDGEKRCIVYMLVNDDCSFGRAGEGLISPMRAHRPLMSMAAFLINTDPTRRQKPPVWTMMQELYDVIGANRARINYIVLAKDLSKRQSVIGQNAVFALPFKPGWLINGSSPRQ